MFAVAVRRKPTVRWPRLLRGVLVAAVAVVAVAGNQLPVRAAVVPYGAVLVPGTQWAGADASRGDLNVYSNGTQNQDTLGTFGLRFECTELVQRWAHYAFGEPDIWPGTSTAADFWRVGPTLPVPLLQHPNGGDSPPQFGDILVYAVGPSSPTGHVAVVSAVSAGSVTAVHQNFTFNGTMTGELSQPLSGTYLAPLGGSAVLGWLRPADGAASSDGVSPIATGNGGQTIFWRGTSGSLYEAWTTGSGWTVPVWVGGSAAAPLASAPSAAVSSTGQQLVFWQGTDGRLHEMWWQPSNGWNGPVTVAAGSALGSAPDILVTAFNQTVFWRSSSGGLEEAWWDAVGGWNGPVLVPHIGGLSAGPAAINSSAADQTVFWAASDGSLDEAWWTPGNGWNGPVAIAGGPAAPGTSPTAAVTGSGQQEVLWQGSDRSLYEATWRYPSWSGAVDQGSGPLGSSPAVDLASSGRQDVFWQGTDANIWTVQGTGSAWSSPASIGEGPLG